VTYFKVLASINISGTAKDGVDKFCTQVDYIIFSPKMTVHPKRAWLGSRDPFLNFDTHNPVSGTTKATLCALSIGAIFGDLE